MEIREDGVRYIKQNNEVFIVGVDEFYSSSITIPEKIDGCPVIKICEYSFTHTNVMSITIPDTVTVIDRGAFYGCGNLRKFKVSYNKNNSNKDLLIGDFAFSGCLNLTEFIAKQSLIKIQNHSFEDCYGLKELNALIKEVCSLGLRNCESLIYLIFADNAIIKDSALEDMNSLFGLTFKGDAKISESTLYHILQNGIRIITNQYSNIADLAYEGYDVSLLKTH